MTGGIAGSHTAVIERLKLRDSVPMAVIGPSGFSSDDTAASICVHSAPISFFLSILAHTFSGEARPRRSPFLPSQLGSTSM